MTTPNSRLARLADLTYRRRGRVVLAWIALLAAVAASAPRIAGEFSSEFTTAGSESQAAADLIAERFPGTSADTIEVVWQAQAGVSDPAVQARVQRFFEQAKRLEGIAAIQSARVSRDGTIALARLELDRLALDVPGDTATRLIDLAEAASGADLRIELSGPPIRNAQEGGSPRDRRADRRGESSSSLPSARSSRSAYQLRSRSSGLGSPCC